MTLQPDEYMESCERGLVECLLDEDGENGDEIDSLIEEWEAPQSPDPEDIAPIVACVLKRKYQYADAILKKMPGNEANREIISRALIITACGDSFESAEAAAKLLDAGGDPAAEDMAKWDVLTRVSRNSPSLSLLEKLIDMGADVNHASRLGITPLLAAVSRGKDDIHAASFAKKLMERGASGKIKAADGLAITDMVRERGSDEMKKLFGLSKSNAAKLWFFGLAKAAVFIIVAGMACLKGRDVIASVGTARQLWLSDEANAKFYRAEADAMVRSSFAEAGITVEPPPDFDALAFVENLTEKKEAFDNNLDKLIGRENPKTVKDVFALLNRSDYREKLDGDVLEILSSVVSEDADRLISAERYLKYQSDLVKKALLSERSKLGPDARLEEKTRIGADVRADELEAALKLTSEDAGIKYKLEER
jgi:hypothetical protein